MAEWGRKRDRANEGEASCPKCLEQELVRARQVDLRRRFPRRGSVVSGGRRREREGLVSTFQRK